MRLCLLVMVGLSACTVQPAIDPPGSTFACDNTIIGTWPESDASADVHPSILPEALLDEEDEEAVISLFDENGDQIPGAVEFEGRRLRYLPDDLLDTNRTYFVEVATCSGVEEFSFTTGPYGEPLEGPEVSRTFALDMQSGRGADGLSIVKAILAEYMLLSVKPDGVLGAFIEGNNQDHCEPTIGFDGQWAALPDFAWGPVEDVVIPGSSEVDGHLPAASLELKGTFAPDLSSIGGIGMIMVLDARVVAPLISDTYIPNDPDEACEHWESITDQACEPCADGQSYCWTTIMEHQRASFTNAPVVPVDVGC